MCDDRRVEEGLDPLRAETRRFVGKVVPLLGTRGLSNPPGTDAVRRGAETKESETPEVWTARTSVW